MNLKIAKEFSLPIDAITQTFAILAKRGVGKTYTSCVMVEEFIKAELPVVILDPIGVWWGLRASADGKKEGLPIIIFGGDHGDVPLEANSGQFIADLVVQDRISAVLDFSLFSKNEQKKFVADFAERLYQKNRFPLHVVFDEADAFAPQKPQRGEERMLGAIESIVRRGRARGIGVTLITQRSAVLNKNVLTQTEVLVALQTTAPQDRKAIKEWTEAHGTPEKNKIFMESLPSLPIGTAWFWSPGWLDVFKKIEIRKKFTFDSSATPSVTKKVKPPKKLADVNLESLKSKMAATIEKSEAEDPRLLRKKIATLEKELQIVKNKPVSTKEIVKEVPMLHAKEIKKLDITADKCIKHGESLIKVGQEIIGKIKQSQVPVKNVERIMPGNVASKKPCRPTPLNSDHRIKDSPEDTKLRSGEERLLETIAMRFPTKYTKAQIAHLTKGFKSSTSGTFSQYWGTLKRHGFIIDEKEAGVTITQKGREYFDFDIDELPETPVEVLNMWKGVLRKGECEILDAVIAAYPNAISKDEIGEKAGYSHTSGTFSQYLGTLKRNKLIYVTGQEVIASDMFF